MATAVSSLIAAVMVWKSGVSARMAASMAGLAYAMRELPVGTAYAVWVGIGASLTVAYAMVTGTEPASALKIALLGGIVVCVIGLKVLD